MSIIDPKYRNKYKASKDWLSLTIDNVCVDAVTKEVTKKLEDGSSVTEVVLTKNTRIDIEKLFSLAAENGLDTTKYRADVDKPNAPGRLRMTIGNMLRAVARKRNGLVVGGVFQAADEAFVDGRAATHNPDGTAIPKAPKAADPVSAEGTTETVAA